MPLLFGAALQLFLLDREDRAHLYLNVRDDAGPPLWPFLVAPSPLRLCPTRDRSCAQSRGVPAQMIFHECGYEIIAVVVAGLTAKEQRDSRLRAGVLQKLGAKLLGQELIGVA